MPRRAPVLAIALSALALTSSSAHAAVITEFTSGLTNSSAPGDAVLGPDGNVWFTENGGIGRITPAGTVTEFKSGLSGDPDTIAVGPDNLVWFTEPSVKKIGKITMAGAITEYSAGTGQPHGIAAGPDGYVWFTDSTPGIGKIATDGSTLSHYGTSMTSPYRITAGPDGAMWFIDHTQNGGRWGRVTTGGTLTETSGMTGLPTDIVTGPDGNLWVSEGGNPGKIARITPSNGLSEWAVPTANQTPTSITVGGDRRLYFTERTGNGALGAITTSGSLSEFTSGLTATSQPSGITAGADGNIWFTEAGTTARIGRLTAPPAASTGAATGLTNDAATLVGTVTPTTETTTYRFDYGTSTSYGSQTSSAGTAAAAGTAQPAGILVSGLAPSTTYHFRVVATNASGTTYGADQTFTTTAQPTTMAYTGTATGVGDTAATLVGIVNPNGLATSYRFEWGTTASYGSRAPASDGSVGADTADHSVSAPISGLAAATTYHYRVVAINSSGTTYGADQILTTAGPPVVATGTATGIGETAATLLGKINPSGLATTYHFEWGTTTSYGGLAPATDASAGADSSGRPVSQQLSGLTAGTTYHYRLVAANGSGTTYGADATFATTPAAPREISALPGPGDPGELVDPGEDAPADVGDGAIDPPADTASLPPAGKPVRGRSVAVQPATGSVTVRLPGTTRDVPLADASRIPVGAVIDATHGQVALTTALDTAGHVQTGRFWGGRFSVAQQRTNRMTTIHLADRTKQCAAKAGSAVAARSAKKHKPSGSAVVNRLWGRDDHGSFRTIGRSASATVRGTQWLTEDRCDGTLVRVAKGAVLVTERRTHRSVLVRAGGRRLVR